MTDTAYNPVVGRDPWFDICTYTADTAAAGYPATNLATMDLNQVYRANGALTAVISGTFSRKVPLGMLGILNHNLSQGGTLVWQIFSDAAWGTQIYTTVGDTSLAGGGDVFPECYSDDQLEVSDDNWWTGTYRTDEFTNKRRHRMIWLGRSYLAQSFKLTLTNIHNPSATSLQIGALIPARGAQLGRGIAIGSQRGHAPNSVVTQADGGKEYGQLKMKPRVFQGSFQGLTRAEADEVLGEMKDRHDITADRPVLWHPFPQEPRQWLRLSFPARFAQLDLQQYANIVRDTVPVNLREIM